MPQNFGMIKLHDGSVLSHSHLAPSPFSFLSSFIAFPLPSLILFLHSTHVHTSCILPYPLLPSLSSPSSSSTSSFSSHPHLLPSSPPSFPLHVYLILLLLPPTPPPIIRCPGTGGMRRRNNGSGPLTGHSGCHAQALWSVDCQNCKIFLTVTANSLHLAFFLNNCKLTSFGILTE